MAILLLAAGVNAAEPRIDRLEPQGVRRGGEVTVTIHGARVGESPEQLMLYEPGVEVTKLEALDKNKASATLRIAGDCGLGRHAIRVRTETGVSNLVQLHVGALETVAEAEPNNQVANAQAIEFERTVLGHVKPEDEDVYRLKLTEGQRVALEVEGLRLGRTFFDPVIEVLDADGEVVAANDDQPAAYSDPFLTFTAPAAADYFVRVRESAYRGDGRSTYLLHVGGFPRPTAVFPPAAKRGSQASVRWIGAGFEQTIDVPADAQRLYEAFASNESGIAPSGLSLLTCDDEPMLEVEPNDSRDQPTPMPCPGVACGVIGAPGDFDHFRISAKAKQVYDLRVVAREVRSPLDAVLRVFDANGKRLAGNDDDRGKPDSYLRFTVPSDGDYVLQVEDRLRRGDESRVYALEVTRPSPAADLTLEERRRYETTQLEVPRGGRCAAMVTVTRRDFGGEVNLDLDGLPDGVTAECLPLAGNYNRVPVVLNAAAEAPLGGGLVGLSVSHVEPDKAAIDSRFRQQAWLVRGRNNVPVWSHFARRAPVVVTTERPFSLSLVQPKAPLCQNGSTELRITAERGEGFDRAVRIYTLYNPPGVSSNRSRNVDAGKSEAVIPVTANGKARVGDWPMVVVGEVNANGRVFVSTQFVTLTVAPAYFDLSVPALDTRQGEAAELVVGLSHRTEFEGEARVELVGLPPGVTAEPVAVKAGDENITFAINVAAEAKPGRHRGVGCRVRLEVEGEPVTYRHGYAELRVDPVEKLAAVGGNY